MSNLQCNARSADINAKLQEETHHRQALQAQEQLRTLTSANEELRKDIEYAYALSYHQESRERELTAQLAAPDRQLSQANAAGEQFRNETSEKIAELKAERLSRLNEISTELSLSESKRTGVQKSSINLRDSRTNERVEKDETIALIQRDLARSTVEKARS